MKIKLRFEFTFLKYFFYKKVFSEFVNEYGHRAEQLYSLETEFFYCLTLSVVLNVAQ